MEMGEEGGGEGVVVGSPSSSWRGGGAGQGHSIPFATLRTQALRKTKTDKDTGMQAVTNTRAALAIGSQQEQG